MLGNNIGEYKYTQFYAINSRSLTPCPSQPNPPNLTTPPRQPPPTHRIRQHHGAGIR